MAFFAAVGAGVEKIGRGRFEIEIETFIGIGGEKTDGFILKKEIADARELDGVWKFIALEGDAGRAGEDVLKGMRWTFKGSTLDIRDPSAGAGPVSR